MSPELQQFEPHILGILGGCLQFLRANSKFPDWAYQIFAVGLAFGGYVLFNPILNDGPREEIVRAMIGASANMLVVWGGTFGVSKTASRAADMGVPGMPVTNSK